MIARIGKSELNERFVCFRGVLVCTSLGPAAARTGFSAGGPFWGTGTTTSPLGMVAPRKCAVDIPTCTSAMRDGHQNGAASELLVPVLHIRGSLGWLTLN